jgi:alpha-mannosidase
VLAHTFKNPAGGYNSKTDLVAVIETWRNFAGKHLNPESLLCFSHGDGGGGPTEEMLGRQRQLADAPRYGAVVKSNWRLIKPRLIRLPRSASR